jgi:NitT/TauT family transport system substrate-binding protein
MSLVQRSLRLLVLACLLVGGLAVTAGAQRPQGTAGLRPVTLQLKWLHQAQFMGFYAAQELGFYRREGLAVTILPGGPDIAPEVVVAGGEAQFGVDWLSALLVARDQGMPLVNIAQIYQESGMRMVTRADSGINDIDDFRGKRVGVWPSGNEYQFDALMAENGLSPPEAFMTVVAQPFSMEPFLDGELDVAHAMIYNELELVYQQLGRNGVHVFDYNQLGVSILEDGLFAEQGWLQQNPGITVRFLRASLQGWHWAVLHPREAAVISFRRAGPDSPGGLPHQLFMAREVGRLIHTRQGLLRGIGYMDPRLYQRTWTTLLDEQVIGQPPSGAFTQVFWRQATGRR